MGRANVQIQARYGRGQLKQQAGAIKAGDFQHRIFVRQIIIDRHLGGNAERLGAVRSLILFCQ